MKLEELEKQVKQLQELDIKNLPPEQLEKIVEQLFTFVEEGENLLSQEIENNESEDWEYFNDSRIIDPSLSIVWTSTPNTVEPTDAYHI